MLKEKNPHALTWVRVITSKYTIHLIVLAFLAAVLIYGIDADSKTAAIFLNGVMASGFDPLIWLIAFPFAIKIRRNALLLSVLFIAGIFLAILKLRMHWIVGSIAGNAIGVVTVGYIINALALVRNGRREKHLPKDTPA